MKSPCHKECKKRCTEDITAENRQMIFTQFNSTLQMDQKRQFISSCVDEAPIERTRTRTGTKAGKRKTSLKYFFSVNNRQKMFVVHISSTH